ncbi:ATP-binding protein [Arthrobacter tecti]
MVSVGNGVGFETSQGRLEDVIAALRQIGTDTRHVEVKASVSRIPKSLPSTLSAFSNSSGGGLVILGLAEDDDFHPAPGFDPKAIADAAKDLVRQRRSQDQGGRLSPVPVAEVDIAEFEGAPVVLIDVAELAQDQKPCFVVSAGPINGSYYRLHDGDHLFSEFEVYSLQSTKRPPKDDSQTVEQAARDDLDPEAVEGFLGQLQSSRPMVFQKLTREEILVRTRVLDESGRHPSLAGLLSFGVFPQQFFPQLMVTFAEFPGTQKGAAVDGIRLVNRATLDGSIPIMIDSAVAAVLRSLKVQRVQRGSRIEEVPEIPADVIREAVANALMHRDYSSYSVGQQVRIELFSDRLVITNPGGIYGGLKPADLWKGISSSRNSVLSKILPDVPLPGGSGRVSENFGTGIQRIVTGLNEMGLDAPIISDSVAYFEIILPRYGLMNEDVRLWLDDLGANSLPINHQRILALYRAKEPLAVSAIRQRLAMDGEEVRDVLERLVADEWLDYPPKRGDAYPAGRRLLQQPSLLPFEKNSPHLRRTGEAGTLAAVRLRFDGGDQLSSREVSAVTGFHINTVRRALRQLVSDGWLVGVGDEFSPKRTYRKK